MPRLSPVLVALALSACAAHEAPPSTTGRAVETPPEVKTPRAELKIAIASVTLQQDCPDPPEPFAARAAPSPAALAPAADAVAPIIHPVPGDVANESPAMGASLARRGPGSGGPWQPPCTQSTMQLSLSNTGDARGTLAIKAVRLLDAASKRPLGTLEARRPGLWSDPAGYQKWDQSILPGATLKASYSLGEPSWPDVHIKLGAASNLYTTPFLLEVDITVDGEVQTVRSPEFLRQEVHMIVT